MKRKVIFLSLLISYASTNAMDAQTSTEKPKKSLITQAITYFLSLFEKKEDSLSEDDFVKLLNSTKTSNENDVQKNNANNEEKKS